MERKPFVQRQLPGLLIGFVIGLGVSLALGSGGSVWPAVALISSCVLGSCLVLISRSGIRVEIFTREPIDVGTRRGVIQAEVTRVRI